MTQPPPMPRARRGFPRKRGSLRIKTDAKKESASMCAIMENGGKIKSVLSNYATDKTCDLQLLSRVKFGIILILGLEKVLSFRVLHKLFQRKFPVQHAHDDIIHARSRSTLHHHKISFVDTGFN